MSNDAGLSDLALANVEVLAYIEWGPDPDPGTFCDLDCYGTGYCWIQRMTWCLPCERIGDPNFSCRC